MQESRYKYTSRLRSVWSSKYFDWIVTQMDEKNEICVGVRSERQFHEALSKIGVTPPSSRTMKDVMKELVQERLLIRIGWGVYKVNPLLSWNGRDARRREEVKTLINSGAALHPNVETAPQGTDTVQPSALSPSRDENNFAEGEIQDTPSQNTDSEQVI